MSRWSLGALGSSVRAFGDCMRSFWNPMRDFGVPGESLEGALALSWGLWVGLGGPWGRSLGRLVRPWPVLKSFKIHCFLLYFDTLELPKGPWRVSGWSFGRRWELWKGTWSLYGSILGSVGSLAGSWRVAWHLLGGSLGLVGRSRGVLGEVFGAFGGCLVPPLGVHGLF